MVLFKIHSQRLTVLPFKSYAPGSVEVNAVTFGLAVQTVERMTSRLPVMALLCSA